MEPILISIALCTYNGEIHLHEQMESLIQQDYAHLEIVIVDDCSTDNTFKLLSAYQQKDARVKLYKNEKNLGFNKNFESTLLRCQGAYVAIADQDDVWELDKISRMHAQIKDSLLLYHDSQLINVEGVLTGKHTSDSHRFVKGQCEQYLLYNNCVSGHTCFFNKDLLPNLLPFPKGFYYDWWMAYTAACLGRINYVEYAFVKHRRHASSATSKDKINDKDLRISNLKLFKAHPLNRPVTITLINELLEGYAALKNSSFSFRLFATLIKNSNTLFYTRRKSLFSRTKFILKESMR